MTEIVLDGVTEILEWTFYKCLNIKSVIFTDVLSKIARI